MMHKMMVIAVDMWYTSVSVWYAPQSMQQYMFTANKKTQKTKTWLKIEMSGRHGSANIHSSICQIDRQCYVAVSWADSKTATCICIHINICILLAYYMIAFVPVHQQRELVVCLTDSESADIYMYYRIWQLYVCVVEKDTWFAVRQAIFVTAAAGYVYELFSVTARQSSAPSDLFAEPMQYYYFFVYIHNTIHSFGMKLYRYAYWTTDKWLNIFFLLFYQCLDDVSYKYLIKIYQ